MDRNIMDRNRKIADMHIHWINDLFAEYEVKLYSDGIHCYVDTSDKEYITKVFAVAQAPITIISNNVIYQCGFAVNNEIVNIWFSCSKKINVDNNGDIWVFPSQKKKLILFDDYNVYEEAKGKFIPLTLKTMFGDLYDNPFFKKVIDTVIMRTKNLLLEDLKRQRIKDGFLLIPATFQEVLSCNNIAELIHKKHKLSYSLNCNWNKRNINVSYMILKSWNYVEPNDRNKLLQIMKIPENIHKEKKLRSKIEFFLTDYLLHKVKVNIGNKNEDEVKTIISDYCFMCIETHKKINLKFCSLKKIREEHDEISEKSYINKTPIIKIKKDTKFKELRNILPQDFEWITTRKSLIRETVIQHHCVWSYADKINKDLSQIYSYVNPKNERYTLEFKIVKGKFRCVQIQGKYNNVNTDEINDIVKNIIKRHYNKD